MRSLSCLLWAATTGFHLFHIFISCCKTCMFNYCYVKITIVAMYNFHYHTNFRVRRPSAAKRWTTASKLSLEGFSITDVIFQLSQQHLKKIKMQICLNSVTMVTKARPLRSNVFLLNNPRIILVPGDMVYSIHVII